MTAQKSPDQASPPLASLKVFETIARTGSIRKAALTLGLDHAGVSRHLKELEAWAGVKLMERSRGGRGRLTPAGMLCHERISSALTEIDHAGIELQESAKDSHLYVYCSHAFARKWLVPRIDDFSRAHPDIDITVRPTESSPDPESPEGLIDIRFNGDWVSPGNAPRLETAILFRPRVLLAVSPSMMPDALSITDPKDISTLPLLFADDFGAWRTWLLRQGGQATDAMRGIRLGNSLLTIEAAKRGRGVCLENELVIADELRAGELLELPVKPQSWPRVAIGSFTMQGREEFWNRGPTRDFRRWLRMSMQVRTPHP